MAKRIKRSDTDLIRDVYATRKAKRDAWTAYWAKKIELGYCDEARKKTEPLWRKVEETRRAAQSATIRLRARGLKLYRQGEKEATDHD